MYKIRSIMGAGFAAFLLLVLSAGCSSGPSQSPEKVIKNFIGKHISMIDPSVADYYVSSEQSSIKELVSQSILSKKKSGVFNSLKNAVYDFSKVSISTLDQKEEYVDDEGINFAKVEAKGNYTLTSGDKSQAFEEDEIFILQSVGGNWKVTEKFNPWK